MVIYSGKACAEVDGRNVTELQPGHFIGSISYVTEETSPANVVAIEPTCYVSWPKSKLKDFMNKNPDLHSVLKSTLAIDLTRRSEEHTSELQSLMRISYAVFCLKNKTQP